MACGDQDYSGGLPSFAKDRMREIDRDVFDILAANGLAIRQITPVCPKCLSVLPVPAGFKEAVDVTGDPTIYVKVACGCGWLGRERFYQRGGQW